MTKDGWILGRKMLTLHDAGAYSRFSPYGLTKHSFHHTGAYTIPNLNFNGYVDFFLLQDLLNDDGTIDFFHKFKDFDTPAVPKDETEYLKYLANSNRFISARNARINTQPCTDPN